MDVVTQELTLFLEDEAATENLGRALAALVAEGGQGLTVFLEGNLGTGKTTLSRGVMRGLGHDGAVKSPTYTIVEPYEHLTPRAYHFDLYRLGDPEELEYMGIRDYFQSGSLCLIEWPERGQGILPVPDLWIHLEVNGNGRKALISSETVRGGELQARLGAMQASNQEV